MEIRRQKEVVEAFHYDMRLPNQEVETDLKVGFKRNDRKLSERT